MYNVKILSSTPSLFRDFAFVILGSFLLALFAQVAIPLPFTPIPLATQSLVVLLLAASLGARRASSAVFAFLVQGAFGLPVFAGGMGGIAIFLGPRGGYLIGYLAAAWIVGFLFERKRDKTLLYKAGTLTLGTLTIYLFGAGYLATLIGFKQALFLGVAPFLLGDALKVLFVLFCLQQSSFLSKSRM